MIYFDEHRHLGTCLCIIIADFYEISTGFGKELAL